MVSLLPVAQRIDTLANGVVGSTGGRQLSVVSLCACTSFVCVRALGFDAFGVTWIDFVYLPALRLIYVTRFYLVFAIEHFSML